MSRKALVPFLALLAAGLAACSSPPTQELASTEGSLEEARAAGARTYATDSFAKAQRSYWQARAEMEAQEERIRPLRRYGRTRELLTQAKAEADRAKVEAEQAKAAADRAKSEAASGKAQANAMPLRSLAGVSRPEVIERVDPVYTEPARKARLQGAVTVEAVIDEEGNVTDVRVLQGLPLGLDQATVDAVREWKFRPARFQGRPVKVYYVLTVNFKVE